MGCLAQRVKQLAVRSVAGAVAPAAVLLATPASAENGPTRPGRSAAPTRWVSLSSRSPRGLSAKTGGSTYRRAADDGLADPRRPLWLACERGSDTGNPGRRDRASRRGDPRAQAPMAARRSRRRVDRHSAAAVSVVGFREVWSTAWGHHTYSDDLSALETAPADGFADELLRWVVADAERRHCDGVHLDSGVGSDRAAAHRWYLRNRMRISAHTSRSTSAAAVED